MALAGRSCRDENGWVLVRSDVVFLWRSEPVVSLTRGPRELCSVASSTHLSFCVDEVLIPDRYTRLIE